MLRITELRLPLDHAEGALRPADRCAARRARRRADGLHRLQACLRRAQEDCDPAHLHRRLRHRRRGRRAGASGRRPACAPGAGHALPVRRPMPRPTSTRRGVRARSWSASAPAACSRRWSWRRWACAPIVLERGKAVRERTQDTWGLWRRGVLDPESNVQFGEGGAGTFSDGKLWSQISDPRHLTRKVLDGVRQGRCAGGDSLRQQAAHRHLSPGRHDREDACRDRSAGRRDPLPAARDRRADRRRRDARCDARIPASSCSPTMSCSRSATARATASRCCTRAACSWRPSRSRSAFASSIRRA